LATAAHIHGPAAPTVAAAVLVGLTPVTNPINGCVTLPKANKNNLKHGMTYVNVHTAKFPGGEIRGQIIPVK